MSWARRHVRVASCFALMTQHAGCGLRLLATRALNQGQGGLVRLEGRLRTRVECDAPLFAGVDAGPVVPPGFEGGDAGGGARPSAGVDGQRSGRLHSSHESEGQERRTPLDVKGAPPRERPRLYRRLDEAGDAGPAADRPAPGRVDLHDDP
jgi:hypothetical protein